MDPEMIPIYRGIAGAILGAALPIQAAKCYHGNGVHLFDTLSLLLAAGTGLLFATF